jgi:hypothetical protein
MYSISLVMLLPSCFAFLTSFEYILALSRIDVVLISSVLSMCDALFLCFVGEYYTCVVFFCQLLLTIFKYCDIFVLQSEIIFLIANAREKKVKKGSGLSDNVVWPGSGVGCVCIDG